MYKNSKKLGHNSKLICTVFVLVNDCDLLHYRVESQGYKLYDVNIRKVVSLYSGNSVSKLQIPVFERLHGFNKETCSYSCALCREELQRFYISWREFWRKLNWNVTCPHSNILFRFFINIIMWNSSKYNNVTFKKTNNVKQQ